MTSSRRAASCIVLPPGAAQRSSAVRPSPVPSSRAGIEAAISCTHHAPSPKPGSRHASARARRRWPGIRLIAAERFAAPARGSAKVRSSGGGAAIAAPRPRPLLAPGVVPALVDPAGSVGTSGSAIAARISVPNTPWTSLRGPPSTSGSTVEMAAWCGVPSASAWTSAMRSAKRALASSGRRLRGGASRSARRDRAGGAASRRRWHGQARGRRRGRGRGRRVERGFERQALAQHRVEQAQRGAARGRAGRIGALRPCSSCLSRHRGRDASKCRAIQTEMPMAERPPHVKPPAYLSPSPPRARARAEPKEAEESGGPKGRSRPATATGRARASAGDF